MNCEHEWWVFSTAIADVCLMLYCSKCNAYGTVDDPTKAEWAAGFYAPSDNYRWCENDRVHIRGEMPEDEG